MEMKNLEKIMESPHFEDFSQLMLKDDYILIFLYVKKNDLI